MSVNSNRSWGVTILRVVAGVVFLRHGLQKLFTMGVPAVVGFLGSAGVPWPNFFGVALPLIEIFCGVALIVGFATRVNAFLLAGEMLVAIVKVHLKNGFFLPMGYEFALTLFAANLCLMLVGGGAASLDAAIWGGKKEEIGPHVQPTLKPAATPKT